jgi:hypothetical protein
MSDPTLLWCFERLCEEGGVARDVLDAVAAIAAPAGYTSLPSALQCLSTLRALEDELTTEGISTDLLQLLQLMPNLVAQGGFPVGVDVAWLVPPPELLLKARPTLARNQNTSFF